MADLSGTIAAGGTAQVIAPFNPARHYLSIQNISDTDMWIAFGAAAVADSPSFNLLAGEIAEWGSDAREMICRPISVIGATTGKKFTATDSIV